MSVERVIVPQAGFRFGTRPTLGLFVCGYLLLGVG
jgi:hypothetical protein